MVTERLLAEIEDLLVFAYFIELVNDFNRFCFFIETELFAGLGEVVFPFLDLAFVCFFYLLNALDKVRGGDSVLFFHHVLKVVVV